MLRRTFGDQAYRQLAPDQNRKNLLSPDRLYSTISSNVADPSRGSRREIAIKNQWHLSPISLVPIAFGIGIVFGALAAAYISPWTFSGTKVASSPGADSIGLYGATGPDQQNVNSPLPSDEFEDANKFLRLISGDTPTSSLRLPRDWKALLFDTGIAPFSFEIAPNKVVERRNHTSNPVSFDGRVCRLAEIGLAETKVAYKILGCALSDAEWEAASITVLSE